jgi:hypothetical protein
MKLNDINDWTAMRPRFVAPTLDAAGVKSAVLRAQTAAPITGSITGKAGKAGMVTGHRPWSSPIT